jgi:hypothetical protein
VEPPRHRRGPVAARLFAVADRLAEGRRETPQRLHALAHHAARAPEMLDALLGFLLAETIAETGPEAGDAALRDLLERVARAVAAGGTDPADELGDLVAEVATLAPRRRRRRHVHCHGNIASDRRLLLLRAVLDIPAARAGPHLEYVVWLALAYAVSDYDHDHFEMIGPRVERRLRRLAAWVAAWPGLDGPARNAIGPARP